MICIINMDCNPQFFVSYSEFVGLWLYKNLNVRKNTVRYLFNLLAEPDPDNLIIYGSRIRPKRFGSGSKTPYAEQMHKAVEALHVKTAC